MLILATDTSGKYGSIALARCEDDSSNVLDLVPLQGGTFSAQLVPQISQLLAKHNLSKSDIDAFAVVSGPGSFTGLRVGLAAIKALAEILGKPIAAMSLLEVIAFGPAADSRDASRSSRTAALPPAIRRTEIDVLTALDAGRNEVYVGEYKLTADRPVCLAESLLTLDQLAQRAGELVCTPDDNVFARLTSHDNGSGRQKVVKIEPPNASLVARLGYQKILAGQTVAPEALDATYIRRADAEIKTASPKPA